MKNFEDSSMADVRKECAIMNTSKHINIVTDHASFVSNNYLWLVMEFLDGGSCTDVMEQVIDSSTEGGIEDEIVIATIINEVMKGLNYLHKTERIHRDVKAGNILLKMDGRVLISDFGVSGQMKKGIKNVTLAGSPCWMAPEVMLKTGHDAKADVWSLGITAIELAMG